MSKISHYPVTSQDWDSFLLEKCEYGIWYFSFCLAKLIAEADLRYRYAPGTKFARASIYGVKDFFKIECERRRKLKASIIKTYYDSLCDWGWIERRKEEPIEKDINFIIDIYPEVGALLNKLNDEINDFKEFTPFWEKKGRPIEIRNIIASIWALVMKEKGKSPWENIEYLLRWFFEKFKNGKTEYYKALADNINEIYENYLKKEHYVIMRNKHNKKNIEYLRGLYFPLSKQRQFYQRIEFKKDYINFPLLTEKGPLITFPDGETFQ